MNYSVLIADDCFGSNDEAERILAGYGMRTEFCAREGEEIIRHIAESKPDAVVMSFSTRGVDALSILRRFKDKCGAPRFLIVYSDDDAAPVDEAMGLGASYCLALPADRYLIASRLDMMRLRSEISAVSTGRRMSVDAEITELLHALAIPANIKGYHYLREAVALYLKKTNEISYITKEIYPVIARRFGTTPQRVERAMRHAIETAWDRGDAEVLNGLFGYTIRADRGKPTNSEFVAFAADKLRMSGACCY